MENKPFVSVLLPVYNCEKYISEAVESILQQTHANFELLIIDDFSTDATLQICKSFQDDRIIIFEKDTNSGISNSLNIGLSNAKGKYLARMDGDDISLPERFEKQVTFLEANPDVAVCGTSFTMIDANNTIPLPEYNDEIKIKLLYGNCIAHPTVMLRKSILTDNAITYDCQMEPAEDFDLWIRLSMVGKLHNLQDKLLNYRVHESQVSTVRNEIQNVISNKIRLKFLILFYGSITNEQQEVYLKIIDNPKQVNFDEFLVFLKLKKEMLEANAINFFNKDDFEKYWSELELKFVIAYFKNRKSHSISVLKQYISVSAKINNRLNFNDFSKLVVKSVMGYKIKPN